MFQIGTSACFNVEFTGFRRAAGELNIIEVMATITKSLYDTDFVEWTAHTAELLRQVRFDGVDLENLVEETKSLGANALRRDPGCGVYWCI